MIWLVHEPKLTSHYSDNELFQPYKVTLLFLEIDHDFACLIDYCKVGRTRKYIRALIRVGREPRYALAENPVEMDVVIFRNWYKVGGCHSEISSPCIMYRPADG